jgi:hypothetical protein
MTVILGVNAGLAAPEEKTVFYAQLVRGNDQEKPPFSYCKPIGPKLAEKLQPIFRFKHYWVIAQREITLNAGQKARVVFNQERAVEIDLTTPKKRTVVAYRDEKALQRVISPVDQEMTILGGDRDSDSAWFIVVRRDKPQDP